MPELQSENDVLPEPAQGTPEQCATPIAKDEPGQPPRTVEADDLDPCVVASNLNSDRFKDRYPNPFTMIGEDDIQDWGDAARTIVELRMCALSSSIREKPQWYVKMQDPTIRGRWREEALSQAVPAGSKKEWALTEKMVCRTISIGIYRC